MPSVRRPPRNRRPTFLKQWRIYRQMTLEQVGKLTHYDHSNIQRLETGQIPYNQDHLELLAGIYRCEPIDLISRNPLTDPDPREPSSNAIKAQIAAALAELLKSIR
jgi:transcriptional regulator with XRE-family HTH domain